MTFIVWQANGIWIQPFMPNLAKIGLAIPGYGKASENFRVLFINEPPSALNNHPTVKNSIVKPTALQCTD